MKSPFWKRKKRERDLNEEIQAHLTLGTREEMESGRSRKEAQLAVRREFGNETLARETTRDMWGWRWLADLMQDVRYGSRMLFKNPGFTAVAVLTLALGIGVNAAIFTTLNSTLWKLLPVGDPQSLAAFSISHDSGPEETDLPAAFVDQLRRSEIFAGVTTTSADGFSFTYDDRAERIVGEVVSPEYFKVLGVQPILGQGFTAQVQAGRWAPEVVLSYGFWKRRFGGDPSVIGRTIHLNTYPFTIVGVSPPSFFGLARGTDYELRVPILPLGQELSQSAQIGGEPDRWLSTIARLKSGQTREQAESAADAQFQQFLSTTSNSQVRELKHARIRLSSAARGDFERVNQFRAPLYVLLILAAIVLLIACVNLANMLLARALGRTREFAVRSSMGAGRWRLVRQMLTENLLLALLGGAAGMALSVWTGSLVARFIPQGHITIAIDAHPDGSTFAFAGGLSLVTMLIFGVLPVVRSTRGDLAATLKSDSAASIGNSRGGLRKALVALQVAFCLVLLVAAGAFVSALSDFRPREYRSDPNHVLLFTMKPQPEIYTDDRKRVLMTELLRRISDLRGVQSVALAENGPLGSRLDRVLAESSAHDQVRADMDNVSPHFFDVVGIPLIMGRDFSMRDTTGSPLVAVVNQSFARAMYKAANPIGEKFSVKYDGSAQWYEIIGVVEDAHYYELHSQIRPGVWLAMLQGAPYMPTLHIRYAGSGGAGMTEAIRREFDAIDKGFPIFNIKSFELRIEDSLWRERMIANLATAFGGLAICLAAIGLYGVLSYTVSRRTREIGIRMALGAIPRSILWLIAREALALTGAGIVAGFAAAMALQKILGRFFIGMPGAASTVLAGCVLLMLIVTTIAVSIPAIRACRINPYAILRDE